MRILGIDYGDSRTGIAISDPLGYTAQPLETVYNQNNEALVIEKIIELTKRDNITTIVFGYPVNMNGTIGPKGEQVLRLIETLESALAENNITGIEIIKRDERLTSVIANKAMSEMGIKKKNKKKLVDRLAAIEILQGYLDAEKD